MFVFKGEGAQLPAAVFRTRDAAVDWIRTRELTGVLTAYPLDESHYDWAVRHSFFTPGKPTEKSPAFVQTFTSGYAPHWQFVAGREKR